MTDRLNPGKYAGCDMGEGPGVSAPSAGTKFQHTEAQAALDAAQEGCDALREVRQHRGTFDYYVMRVLENLDARLKALEGMSDDGRVSVELLQSERRVSDDLRQRNDALRAEIERLRAALQSCVAALDSEEMKGVWVYLYTHGYKWTGPVVDMISARRALEGKK